MVPDFAQRRAALSARHARIGRCIAFAAVVLAGVLAALWWHLVAGAPGYSCVLFFPSSANGLSQGSPVKMRGVTIGHVESLGLRPPRGAQTAFHAVARVRIDPRQLARQGVPGHETATAWLARETKQGLRGKRALLNPSTGNYYIELGYDTTPPPAPVSAPDEGLNEIPVVPEVFSNEKLGTYTDWLAAFSEKDFSKLEVEWNTALDAMLEASNPERVKAFNTTVLARLDKIKHLLRDSRLREDCRDINEKLAALRASATGRDSAALLLWVQTDAPAALAQLRASFSRAAVQTAELASLLDIHSTEIQAFLETLSRLRKACETLRVWTEIGRRETSL